MKISIFYVGSSLPGPLAKAERDINARHNLNLTVASHNCGAEIPDDDWWEVEQAIADSDLVFIIHITNQENASRIIKALERYRDRHRAVVAINCMPDLMRRTRMGGLDFGRLGRETAKAKAETASFKRMVRKLGTWMAETVKHRRAKPGSQKPFQYAKLIERLPTFLKLVPRAGKLGDIKNYLYLYCYFLQPTPQNIRSMLLYAIKYYVPEQHRLKVDPPESFPATAVYHPDAPRLFETFEAYEKWYRRARGRRLDPDQTIGLLLMRTQLVSQTRDHYDYLIRSIEAEGLAVIPAASTFMDNRDACSSFFAVQNGDSSPVKPRVSQIVSLTGFSFVGGPAMHDSEAAVAFLKNLNVPLRSMISLDVQTIENWEGSRLGLNPLQTAMQVAIPEIDGATEPFIFGGMPASGVEPIAIKERCGKIARRLARWNRLHNAPRSELKHALIVFCFPPNKGNVGTAAELDVFPSLFEVLTRLRDEGYLVDVPESVDALRSSLLREDSADPSAAAAVGYRMSVDEYRSLCPYVEEIEREWGPAPGRINSDGRELIVNGIHLGNVFIGIQPTFGYEGDPMRLLMAESGAPHHGFMALYTYIEKIFRADSVIHVGTHGALEFMPGKQAGLSSRCWPDRLIGELPNIYIYSVNNPSEGTIAKRRSYAELVSYLTPPIENAGLYKGLASLKELVLAYRQSSDDREREQLFEAIEEEAKLLHLSEQQVA